jgi:putative tricarboxylic transport membrane protein
MSEHAEGAAGPGPSHRAVEAGVAVVIAIFACIVIYGSMKVGTGWGAEGPKAGFFPFYVGIIILISSAVNLGIILLDKEANHVFAEWSQLRMVMSVVIPTAIYVGFIPFIGIYIPSMILIAFFMRWLGKYGVPIIAAVALGVPVAFFVVFERWFLVPLPKGPVEYWLGF